MYVRGCYINVWLVNKIDKKCFKKNQIVSNNNNNKI